MFSQFMVLCVSTADHCRIDEVQGLKDELGGGGIVDDSQGYVRASNKDSSAIRQEAAVDQLE